jgi:hypothetical protein
MKVRLLFILTLISITAFSAAAQQRRAVTNDNLEKYRQKRVAAERDLRENYERLGFPSPEELDRQIEQSRAERSELAERLRAENLERERLNLDRQIAESEAQQRRSDYLSSPNKDFYGGANDFFFNYGYAPFSYNFPNFGYPNYYPFGGFNRRGFRNQPRIEYRNNLPVFIPPPGRRIVAPSSGRRRN